MTRPISLLGREQVAAGAGPGDGCGPGALATARGHLPLKSVMVAARIDGLVARTEVEQTFVNNLGETIEATYIFPLPDRAAVTSFQLLVAGRTIDGLLKERGEARREYHEAIAKGHRAAIAEEERPDVFTLRVGNLPPNEEIRVKLALAGRLVTDLGEATYRFPLVVAPRYIPGVPLEGEPVGDGCAPDTDAVPDASRIRPPVLLPGYLHPVRLEISVDLNAASIGASDLRASLPATSEELETGLERIRVAPGQRLDQDFLLRFRIGAGTVTTSLIVERDAGGADEGTFLLTVVPPAGVPDVSLPRDIAFVLDRSGSMQGWKMVAARRAMASMVETLRDTDRLSVLAFDHVIESPWETEDLVPATNHHRSVAAEFLARVEARGSTEMATPLWQAIDSLARAGQERDRVLVLVTDGQIGNEDQVLREIESDLRSIRVFALGIDRAVNAGFLNRLAAASGGACELVESEDRLEAVLEKVHRLLAAPVLTDLRLDPAGLEIQAGTVTPSRLPGLFAAVPVTVLGRWSGSGTGSLALRAIERDGAAWTGRPLAVEGKSGALAALWARGRVRDLEDAYTCGRGHELGELEKEIVATSLRFSVLSRFTAYVAVDRDAVVEKGGDLHRVVQPVEMPAGWEMQSMNPMRAVMLSGPGSGITSFRGASRLMHFSLGPDDDQPTPTAIPELVERLLKDLRAPGTRSERVRRSLLEHSEGPMTELLYALGDAGRMGRKSFLKFRKLYVEVRKLCVEVWKAIQNRSLDPTEVDRLLAAIEKALEEILTALAAASPPQGSSATPPPASSRTGAAEAPSTPPLPSPPPP